MLLRSIYFSFEITPYPPSLLKDGLMRKADKAAPRRAIMSHGEAVRKDQIDKNSLYVVDGGALLHRIRWFKDSTFNAFWLNSVYLTLEDIMVLLMLFLMGINMLP